VKKKSKTSFFLKILPPFFLGGGDFLKNPKGLNLFLTFFLTKRTTEERPLFCSAV
jgi:hypothetical protein